MGAFAIGPLSDAREATIVADWIWREWAQHEPGVTREASDATVFDALEGRALPHFVVARIEGTPIGCASIVDTDLPTRPDLGPWLANVYVVTTARGQGVGAALVERAMRHGLTVANPLYLYTFGATAMYERLGWRAHDTGHYTGRPITILQHEGGGRVPARSPGARRAASSGTMPR